jgi:hypothetical protein
MNVSGIVHPTTGHEGTEGSRGIAPLFFLTSMLDGNGWLTLAPAALRPGKTRYPLYRRPGKTQGRPGRERKISLPQGLDPRTGQLVASRYTDYTIPAPYERLTS